jgi:V/A-type H+/Na+-transporting ATPase subunit K
MSTIRTFRALALLSIALLGFFALTTSAGAQEHGTGTAQETAALSGDGQQGQGAKPAADPKATGVLADPKAMGFLAVAITMSGACLAAAFAVGKVGAAAMGAAAEKPEILTKAIVFAGLGEGIAIFGLIVSIFLIAKL